MKQFSVIINNKTDLDNVSTNFDLQHFSIHFHTVQSYNENLLNLQKLMKKSWTANKDCFYLYLVTEGKICCSTYFIGQHLSM